MRLTKATVDLIGHEVDGYRVEFQDDPTAPKSLVAVLGRFGDQLPGLDVFSDEFEQVPVHREPSTPITTDEPFPGSAPNCDVESPPPTSGEDVNHGFVIKIHPRRSSVKTDYTGCQTMWFEIGREDWMKMQVTYFEEGELKVIWTPGDGSAHPETTCRYSQGRLEPGMTEPCHEVIPEWFPQGSWAAGCMRPSPLRLHSGAVFQTLHRWYRRWCSDSYDGGHGR